MNPTPIAVGLEEREGLCHVLNCSKPRKGRYRKCSMHQARWARNGSIELPEQSSRITAPAWPNDPQGQAPGPSALAWAAGLFEGEGCFYLAVRKTRRDQPRAAIVMTDEDVLRHFHRTVGLGRINGPFHGRQAHHKATWQWTVAGVGNVAAVFHLLAPWLGERRTTKAKQVLYAGI